MYAAEAASVRGFGRELYFFGKIPAAASRCWICPWIKPDATRAGLNAALGGLGTVISAAPRAGAAAIVRPCASRAPPPRLKVGPSVFGGAVVASILAGSVEGMFPSADGFTAAFAACAIAVALGVLVGLAIPQRGAGAVARMAAVPGTADA